MLKALLVFAAILIWGKPEAQRCLNCKALFNAEFLYYPHQNTDRWVFHYVFSEQYNPLNGPKKRTEDYRYLHNGDDVKGTLSILNQDMEGSQWLKNFDFGKFANVIVEMGNTTREKPKGIFEWSGKLLFFKVFNRRRLGGLRH
ncbi:MAG: hypothetical protein JWO06_192 [Bacteroidota bacterium]|nr:hypothetical protein [Bacteroidota bacterium]